MSEFRFDDLDLREEPCTADSAQSTVYNTGAPPLHGGADLQISFKTCTQICCV